MPKIRRKIPAEERGIAVVLSRVTGSGNHHAGAPGVQSRDGVWQKWGPYGFGPDGRLCLEEYYPDAIERTYKGVSGYIYHAEEIADSGFEVQIPDAATSSLPVKVTGVEYVPDAYEAILRAEREGLIIVRRYKELTDRKKEWIAGTIREEYASATEHPEYRHFLQGCFPEILKN